MSKIIVAVNGSSSARAAFGWAWRHVDGDAGRLLVVTAFDPTPVGLDAAPIGFGPDGAMDRARANATANLRAVAGDDTEGIEHHVVIGPLLSALRAHTSVAELTVVGARARRTWWQRLRPSTAAQIARLFEHPVIVVPDRSQPGTDRSLDPAAQSGSGDPTDATHLRR